MATKATSSIAITGPKDELLAADARGKTPAATLAKSTGALATPFSKAVDTARNSGLNFGDLGAIVSIKDGKLGIDPKQAGSRIDQAAGVNLSGIAGVNPNVKTRALENLIGLTGNADAIDIINQTGDILKIDRNTDTSSAKGIASAVGKLFGIPTLQTFADRNAIVATGLSLLEEAISLGIPTLIDTLMDKVDRDKDAKKKLIQGTRGVILKGDINTLNKILDWIGAEGVLFKVPNAIQLLLAAYKFPPNVKPDQYPSLRTELINVITRINPKWNVKLRNGVELVNLEVFTRISTSSKTLLLLPTKDTPVNAPENEYLMAILAAPFYKVTSIKELANQQYPNLGLWR